MTPQYLEQKCAVWECPHCGTEHRTPSPVDRCNHICGKCESIFTFDQVMSLIKHWIWKRR